MLAAEVLQQPERVVGQCGPSLRDAILHRTAQLYFSRSFPNYQCLTRVSEYQSIRELCLTKESHKNEVCLKKLWSISSHLAYNVHATGETTYGDPTKAKLTKDPSAVISYQDVACFFTNPQHRARISLSDKLTFPALRCSVRQHTFRITHVNPKR